MAIPKPHAWTEVAHKDQGMPIKSQSNQVLSVIPSVMLRPARWWLLSNVLLVSWSGTTILRAHMSAKLGQCHQNGHVTTVVAKKTAKVNWVSSVSYAVLMDGTDAVKDGCAFVVRKLPIPVGRIFWKAKELLTLVDILIRGIGENVRDSIGGDILEAHWVLGQALCEIKEYVGVYGMLGWRIFSSLSHATSAVGSVVVCLQRVLR